jgi:sulfopyruvate decarboxylase alpha subunit
MAAARNTGKNGKGGGKRSWQHDVYDVLRKHGVSQFAYVPDAGHSVMIDLSLADKDVHSIALTTEEEGVAVAAGAHLGDARAVVLMQSSGLGNCVNFLSMIRNGHFPFLTILSMRGEFGEGNPWQIGMGQAVRPVLEAMDIICLEITDEKDAAPTVEAAATMAFKSGSAVAVLLTQKLLGAKAF